MRGSIFSQNKRNINKKIIFQSKHLNFTNFKVIK